MGRKRTITLKLGRHPSGYWQKRIDGKLRYFGDKGCTEDAARECLVAFIHARQSGTRDASDSCTVGEIAAAYAQACEARCKRGKMARSTFNDYDATIADFVLAVGKATTADSMTPERFADVAARWGKLGATRRGNQIQYVRTMFKWAADERLIASPPFYGRAFAKADRAQVRAEKRVRERERGARVFTASEIKTMLAKADGIMRAFVLLGLNGGMYSADVADLRQCDIRRDGKGLAIDTERRKTSALRVTPLWPETATALAPYWTGNGSRPIFLTRHGNAWNQRDNHTDSLGLAFRRWVTKLGIHRDGLGFGTFRHTHVSAVNDHPDADARKTVRGHVMEGIDAHYDVPDMKRLRSVTALARRRLVR